MEGKKLNQVFTIEEWARLVVLVERQVEATGDEFESVLVKLRDVTTIYPNGAEGQRRGGNADGKGD